jgi:LPS-assembly lipoprotein
MMKHKPTLTLFMLIALTGCGFQPLYGTGTNSPNTSLALNQIAIAHIPDRDGQVLRNYLIDRLYHDGRPSDPDYTLDIALEQSEAGLGIKRDATASRNRLDMNAHYSVKQRSTGKTLIDDHAKTSVSYNQLEAQYATLTAREDARDRALHEVSEQIISRLALYFGTEQKTP